MQSVSEAPAIEPAERRMRTRIWQVLIALLLLFACLGSSTLLFLLDQTSLAAQAYLQSVNSGNSGIAELMGDHYSDDRDWHQRFFHQDVQRDLEWLQGAHLTDVTTSREQTLSGQWVTILRFNYTPANPTTPNQAKPRPGALRVKTDHWLLITYIRAVELLEQ
jgi:hypothetical protein